jgi:hypothetical protein
MSANDFQYASVPLPGDIAVKNTEASADILAGNVVKLDASHPVSGTQGHFGALLCTVAAYPLGVAMEKIPNGKTGRVRPHGVAQVVASAPVTAGDVVAAAASAKVATQTSGQPQLGQALTAAAGDGDRILVAIAIAKNA